SVRPEIDCRLPDRVVLVEPALDTRHDLSRFLPVLPVGTLLVAVGTLLVAVGTLAFGALLVVLRAYDDALECAVDHRHGDRTVGTHLPSAVLGLDRNLRLRLGRLRDWSALRRANTTRDQQQRRQQGRRTERDRGPASAPPAPI